MNLNRDEFLLLSRTGRGLHSTRAGPRRHERFETERGARRFRRRSGLTLRTGVGRGLRHVLGSRSRSSTRVNRTPDHVDEQAYFELEFAVGFPAEEETLR